MPKFLIEREIPGAGDLSPEQLRAVSQKSCDVLRGMVPLPGGTRPIIDLSAARAVVHQLTGHHHS